MSSFRKHGLPFGVNNLHDNLKYSSIGLKHSEISNESSQKFVSSIFLFFKICLFLLAAVSLLKIGYVSKIRIIRLREIKKSYLYEKDKYEELTKRFDDLFSLNGQQRFMKDQDQIISRDRMRVIWR